MNNWYAIKVYFNRIEPVRKVLSSDDVRYYIPVHKKAYETDGRVVLKEEQLIPSLVFVYSDEEYIKQLKNDNYGKLMVYSNFPENKPTAIPEKEMEVFIFVTSVDDRGLEYLGDDLPKYHIGNHVRVIDGIFKGAEGYIKRIKKDRRLIVSVRGVAAVATSFIHPSFLEIIE